MEHKRKSPSGIGARSSRDSSKGGRRSVKKAVDSTLLHKDCINLTSVELSKDLRVGIRD